MHWIDGGRTTLNNGVLLCGYHHTTIHHRGWTVTIAADGKPEFTAPPWIDPGQTPQRQPRAP